MTVETVRIDDRYCGFPGMAMGGFAGGLLSRRVGAEAEVTFQRPIPTGEALELATTDDGAELRLGEDVAASATASALIDESGGVTAVARHTLVVTDWGVPLGVARWDDRE